MTTCQLQMCTMFHKVLIGWCALIPVVNPHIYQLQHYKHNITSGARYPGVPSGRMEANFIIWSVGSFIPSPDTVPAESKSPSLTWNLELHLQISGLHWHCIWIIMLLAKEIIIIKIMCCRILITTYIFCRNCMTPMLDVYAFYYNLSSL